MKKVILVLALCAVTFTACGESAPKAELSNNNLIETIEVEEIQVETITVE